MIALPGRTAIVGRSFGYGTVGSVPAASLTARMSDEGRMLGGDSSGSSGREGKLAKAWKKTAGLRRHPRPIYNVAVSGKTAIFAQGCVYGVEESDGTNVMRGTAASGGISTPCRQPVRPRPGRSMVPGCVWRLSRRERCRPVRPCWYRR